MAIDRRKEIMDAAATGIREYVSSIRGAHACGPSTEVILDPVTYRIQVIFREGIITIVDSSWERVGGHGWKPKQ